MTKEEMTSYAFWLKDLIAENLPEVLQSEFPHLKNDLQLITTLPILAKTLINYTKKAACTKVDNGKYLQAMSSVWYTIGLSNLAYGVNYLNSDAASDGAWNNAHTQFYYAGEQLKNTVKDSPLLELLCSNSKLSFNDANTLLSSV